MHRSPGDTGSSAGFGIAIEGSAVFEGVTPGAGGTGAVVVVGTVGHFPPSDSREAFVTREVAVQTRSVYQEDTDDDSVEG